MECIIRIYAWIISIWTKIENFHLSAFLMYAESFFVFSPSPIRTLVFFSDCVTSCDISKDIESAYEMKMTSNQWPAVTIMSSMNIKNQRSIRLFYRNYWMQNSCNAFVPTFVWNEWRIESSRIMFAFWNVHKIVGSLRTHTFCTWIWWK